MEQGSQQLIKEHLVRQFNLTPEQIERMLPSFLETIASHLDGLEGALAENDPMRIGRAGHTIKGAFLNLGLDDCAVIARQIEERGKAEDRLTDYAQLVSRLRLLLAPLLRQHRSVQAG
jgi:HPt (histidine-containing phosphotransfer) domain-containing protein